MAIVGDGETPSRSFTNNIDPDLQIFLAPVHLGAVDGRRVAFIPRHGPAHEFPPHRVNYRANLWAMSSLGVNRVVGPFANRS